VHRLLGARGEDQRLRVAEPDVLRSKDDEPPRDEERILPAIDHPHEPVERAVGIRPADALDEGRDGVVVGVPRPVVHEGAPLERVLHAVEGHVPLGRGIGGELERVKRDPRIAVGDHDQRVLGILIEPHGAGEAAFVGERASHDRTHVLFGQRLQSEDTRA